MGEVLRYFLSNYSNACPIAWESQRRAFGTSEKRFNCKCPVTLLCAFGCFCLLWIGNFAWRYPVVEVHFDTELSGVECGCVLMHKPWLILFEQPLKCSSYGMWISSKEGIWNFREERFRCKCPVTFLCAFGCYYLLWIGNFAWRYPGVEVHFDTSF